MKTITGMKDEDKIETAIRAAMGYAEFEHDMTSFALFDEALNLYLALQSCIVYLAAFRDGEIADSDWQDINELLKEFGQ